MAVHCGFNHHNASAPIHIFLSRGFLCGAYKGDSARIWQWRHHGSSDDHRHISRNPLSEGPTVCNQHALAVL